MMLFCLRKQCDLIWHLYLTWPQISVREDWIRSAPAPIPSGSRAEAEFLQPGNLKLKAKHLKIEYESIIETLPLIGNYSLIHIQMLFFFFYSGWAVSGWTSGGNLCSLSDWKTAASSKAVDTQRCDTPYLADCEPCGTVPLSSAASEQAFPSLGGERDANCISWLLILWRTEHSHGFTLSPASSSQVQALFFFFLPLFFYFFFLRPVFGQQSYGELQRGLTHSEIVSTGHRTDVAKLQLLQWGIGGLFIVT